MQNLRASWGNRMYRNCNISKRRSPSWLAKVGLGGYVPSFADLGVPGDIALQILEVYFMIVSMRIIGLYYLHYKKHFAIVME